MATTTVVQIQNLQQQVSGTCFEYQIYNQANPIVYDSGTDTVRKCFTSGATTNTVGHINTLNSTNNQVDDNQFLDGFDDDVHSVVRQSSGKLVVVTQAQTYQGNLIGNDSGDLMILRLNTDGIIDSTFTKVTFFKDNPVYLRLQSNDKIIVFGDFTYQGIYNGIMRLNINGGFDGSFQVSNGFLGGYPYDVLVLPSDAMIVVGSFTDYYAFGFSPTGLGNTIGLKADGSAETTVGQFAYPYPIANSIVTTVKRLSNGNLVFGGAFSSFDSNPRVGITQTTATGVDVPSFGQFQFGFVTNIIAIHPTTNDVYAQGSWSTYNGGSVPKFVKLSSGGTLDATFDTALTAATSFNANPNREAFAFGTDGNLVAAGGFGTYNGVTVNRYVEINPITAAIINKNATFNSSVYGVLHNPSNSTKICFGNFTQSTSALAADGLFQVPLGTTSANTLTNIFNNLNEFNTIAGMVYTQLGNSIFATYTTSNSFITVQNIDDIPSYLLITSSGQTEPPQILFSGSPQSFTPAYNPITFQMYSPDNQAPGFRYKIGVYQTSDDELIQSFNVIPQVDGSGYIDISRIIQDRVSYSFDQTSLGFSDAANSYLNFYVTLGAEYQVSYPFVSAITQTTGIYSGATTLKGDGVTSFPYVAGDLINITSNVTGSSLSGLHQIVEIQSSFEYTIDLEYSNTFSSATGTTIYSNNRRTIFPNTDIVEGLTAFNGARAWGDFINWSGPHYTMRDGGAQNKALLTNLPDNFYVTPSQDLWLNYFNKSLLGVQVYWLANTGQFDILSAITGTFPDGKVCQFAAGPEQLGITGETEWYEIALLDTNFAYFTYPAKRIYIDNRCKIEDYEVLFMDRMGSFASYAFQLRSKEFGDIDKTMYKKSVIYDLDPLTYAQSYDIADRGMSVTNVTFDKKYELNTNWMTDEMSVYFEELLTSPITFFKLDGLYYACTVEEKSYEVMRQKNKNLIKKTITVKLANDSNINI